MIFKLYVAVFLVSREDTQQFAETGFSVLLGTNPSTRVACITTLETPGFIEELGMRSCNHSTV